MLDRSEIRSLTGLRGIAALFVVSFHYFQSTSLPGPVGIFLRHGYIAVDLFFVLSGFVMSRTYARDFATGVHAKVYRDFLMKRLGRVFPLYLCVFIATTVTMESASVQTLLANVFMAQSVVLEKSVVRPSWSISTEFVAYLLFPALVWAALMPGALRAWASAALACLALAVVARQMPIRLWSG